jgi:thioester reductase-like protein
VNHSKPIADLSPGDKRSLLVKLLRMKASGPAGFRDQLGMNITDLQGEVVLDSTIQPEVVPLEPMTEPAHIFLTGATGFLGSFILYELLQQTKADIYCLVRSANVEEGKKKLHSMLASYVLWREELSPRIIPVVGDLSAPLLGLSGDQFRTLATKIDAIYHNGALVNWIASYDRLKPTNVLGTQEVLRLASDSKAKPVHYISTAAVFPVLANSEVKAVREQDPLDHGGVLYGGYSQSKWVAEKLVGIARSRGMPVCIYRPVLITGHSQTGVWNTDDVLCRFIKSSVELGRAPDIEATLNMVPVDYVSKAVVHLSRQDTSRGKVFHLTNSHPVYWRELVTWLRAFGYPVQQIPYDMWRPRLIDLGRLRGNAASYLVPLFSLRLSEEGSSLFKGVPQFDCQNTLAGLAGTSIVCPLTARQMFETYFSYFIRCGFLNAPPLAGVFETGKCDARAEFDTNDLESSGRFPPFRAEG